jgi:hypothetical protein
MLHLSVIALNPRSSSIRYAGCGLRVAGCGLRVAGCGLRVAGCGLRADSFDCGLMTVAEKGEQKYILRSLHDVKQKH